MHHCIFFLLQTAILSRFLFLIQPVYRYKSVVPIREALIISENKPSFVVPFRIITHLLLRKNSLRQSKCNLSVSRNTT